MLNANTKNIKTKDDSIEAYWSAFNILRNQGRSVERARAVLKGNPNESAHNATPEVNELKIADYSPKNNYGGHLYG